MSKKENYPVFYFVKEQESEDIPIRILVDFRSNNWLKMHGIPKQHRKRYKHARKY